MRNIQKWELVAGFLLLMSPCYEAGARDTGQLERGTQTTAAYLDGPNILEMMILDNEQVVPPTPVNGSYLMGLVVKQFVQANWVQGEIGLQLYHEGEKLDPRRYQIEWKLLVSPYSVVKARLVDFNDFDFNQKIQIEMPLNRLNGRVIGSIEIEARVSDREQPDKAPLFIVQTLRELLANGRDGL